MEETKKNGDKKVPSPDIRRAIEIIEHRIQLLQRIKEMLAKEFWIEAPLS